jgi:hypothetical protein
LATLVQNGLKNPSANAVDSFLRGPGASCCSGKTRPAPKQPHCFCGLNASIPLIKHRILDVVGENYHFLGKENDALVDMCAPARARPSGETLKTLAASLPTAVPHTIITTCQPLFPEYEPDAEDAVPTTR